MAQRGWRDDPDGAAGTTSCTCFLAVLTCLLNMVFFFLSYVTIVHFWGDVAIQHSDKSAFVDVKQEVCLWFISKSSWTNQRDPTYPPAELPLLSWKDKQDLLLQGSIEDLPQQEWPQLQLEPHRLSVTQNMSIVLPERQTCFGRMTWVTMRSHLGSGYQCTIPACLRAVMSKRGPLCPKQRSHR